MDKISDEALKELEHKEWMLPEIVNCRNSVDYFETYIYGSRKEYVDIFHYMLFNNDKHVVILCETAIEAREVHCELLSIEEELPDFLRHTKVRNNHNEILYSNGTKIRTIWHGGQIIGSSINYICYSAGLSEIKKADAQMYIAHRIKHCDGVVDFQK